MEYELAIRLVLVDPPPGVDFGIQSGSGSQYETLFVQLRIEGDIFFDFSLTAKQGKTVGSPDFRGRIVQGTPANRFVYIDVGTYAGQQHTHWARRMKVPLEGISWEHIVQAAHNSGHRLLGSIAGRGKDGGPNCATVKLLDGWKVIKTSADQTFDIT
jgi:hypothetical protein